MLLYKHFKDEKYLNDWLDGSFVFTKLPAFFDKEKTEDHFTDHHEASVIASIKSEKLLLRNFGDIDLFKFSDKKIYKPIPTEEAKFVLISSFATETNERLRSEFGKHVLEFDFNEKLQTLLLGDGKRMLFGEVIYRDHHGEIFSNKESQVTQVIGSTYKEILSKNEDLAKSILFRKRSQYDYQKEFRFALILKKELLKRDCESFYQALLGDKENYFPVTIEDDEIRSLKPFFKGLDY